MQTIKASEFKAKCLALMDQVKETGDEIVITKNGKARFNSHSIQKGSQNTFLVCMWGSYQS